jgi:hypothetical protein
MSWGKPPWRRLASLVRGTGPGPPGQASSRGDTGSRQVRLCLRWSWSDSVALRSPGLAPLCPHDLRTETSVVPVVILGAVGVRGGVAPVLGWDDLGLDPQYSWRRWSTPTCKKPIRSQGRRERTGPGPARRPCSIFLNYTSSPCAVLLSVRSCSTSTSRTTARLDQHPVLARG